MQGQVAALIEIIAGRDSLLSQDSTVCHLVKQEFLAVFTTSCKVPLHQGATLMSSFDLRQKFHHQMPLP